MILQKREKIILWSCVVLIGIAMLYVFAVDQYFKCFQRIDTTLRSKQQLLRSSKGLLAQKESLDNDYSRLRKLLPAQGAIDEYASRFIIKIEKIARGTGIRKISSITPLPVKQAEGYQRLEAQINMEADISGLTRFLYELASGRNLLRIESLQVNNSMDNPDPLKIQVVASTMYIEK
ncbi:MAG: type 4a pilus biogenesis protein PilO [Elusimicrobia bacterium]|nr:type 4a pilus biogenesis protein PilO [Elusimicrobiota bacterium]